MQQLQAIKNKIYSLDFWLDLGSSFWALGLLYVALYFVFEVLLKDWYHTPSHLAAYNDFANQKIDLSFLFENISKFILPAILLLVIFIAFAFLYQKIKKKNIAFVLLNSYFVIVIFTFLTLKVDWFIKKSYLSFENISWGEILAFMIIYGLPIVVSLILKEKHKKQYLTDAILYLVLFVLIIVFYLVQSTGLSINLLYLFYSVGLLYYISSMVALLSFLDLSTVFEDSIIGNLLYLVLPIFLMVSYFTVANLFIFGIFAKIFMIKEAFINIYAPVEHIYFYLYNLINYTNWIDFAYGLLSISAIVTIVLVVYRKMHLYVDKYSFWRVVRSLGGLAFFVYFIVQGII